LLVHYSEIQQNSQKNSQENTQENGVIDSLNPKCERYGFLDSTGSSNPSSPVAVFWRAAGVMSQPKEGQKTNPAARDAAEVLGTEKPDTVSAAAWVRPYRYLVVRVDDNRIEAFDDNELGRILSSGLHTRHNAIGRKAVLSRRTPESTEYRIIAEENESHDQSQ